MQLFPRMSVLVHGHIRTWFYKFINKTKQPKRGGKRFKIPEYRCTSPVPFQHATPTMCSSRWPINSHRVLGCYRFIPASGRRTIATACRCTLQEACQFFTNSFSNRRCSNDSFRPSTNDFLFVRLSLFKTEKALTGKSIHSNATYTRLPLIYS